MRSLVSLTFDDGLRCQFEKAVPILDRYRISATFFLTANDDSTHEPWNGHRDEWWKIDWRKDDIIDLRRLIDNGHEIGSHSLTHHWDKMPQNPTAEAGESKRLIEGWIGSQVTSFSYPYYSSHVYLADAVKDAGYQQARGGCRDSYYTTGGELSLDKFNVDCLQVSTNAKASEWVQPGRWRILTFHGIGDNRDGWEPISVAQFEALIAELARYRDAGRVEALTFRDALVSLESRPLPLLNGG